ncbi:hypothetical protein D3C87_2084810 [compost metagenome]
MVDLIDAGSQVVLGEIHVTGLLQCFTTFYQSRGLDNPGGSLDLVCDIDKGLALAACG